MIEMMWIEDAEEAYISSVESRLYAKHDVIDHEISVDDAPELNEIDEVHEEDPFACTDDPRFACTDDPVFACTDDPSTPLQSL